MPKQFTNWLDEFVQNGADKDNVPDWSTQSGGGGSYTPGNGINIVGNEISVDTQTIATKEDLNNYEPAEDAFSGDYNDLTNKPDLATVATSGSYDDLTNQPTITNVEANSGEPTTATLNTLTVGDTVYSIPGGGSGSEYHAGDGISIDEDNNISANIYGDNDTIYVSHGCEGELEIGLDDNYKVIANSGDDPTTSLSTLTVGDTVYNTSYTAGSGIDITDNEISVDSDIVAMKTDIPDAVSGVHDTANWISLTIGSDTYAIPTSSGSGEIINVSSSTVVFYQSTKPGIYKVTSKPDQSTNKVTIKLCLNNGTALATLELPSYYASADGSISMYLFWMNTEYANTGNMWRRSLIGFCGSGSPEIITGYADYGLHTTGGELKIHSIKTDYLNRSYTNRLTLNFIESGQSTSTLTAYLTFTDSRHITSMTTQEFKDLFTVPNPIVSDTELWGWNHNLLLYKSDGQISLGVNDIYYDETNDKFGTIDGTYTDLTLDSISYSYVEQIEPKSKF